MEKISKIPSIHRYEDFVDALRIAGMSMGGENDEGIFSLCSLFGEEIEWHTEKPDTDPWEWRIRVLDEFDDIAYGKLFFKKSGYLTKEWYPYFYTARRQGRSFEEIYKEGKISAYAKKIYKIVSDRGAIPLHAIKKTGDVKKEDKSKFDRAIIELQMGMFITVCGRARKISFEGQEYGWSSTVFCTTEEYFGGETIEKAAGLTPKNAYGKIENHLYTLNPNIEEKKIEKFIYGI